tara:strand:- start:1308 stop:1574 length:267 start_codon:yes stop_codon:yes gene_type:complete
MAEDEKKPQMAFFDKDEGTIWKDHWKEMPEFRQEDLTAFKELVVRFENQADLDAFAALLDQKINTETFSVWYPKITIGRMSNKRFNDV